MPKETLRSLTSKVPPPDEVEKIMLGLARQNYRTAAIVGAAMVESRLESVITSALKSGAADLSAKLFENRGPLSDFNSKILIAQAFGLVADRLADDLQRIRRIRNCFAHARVSVDFETQVVAREVSEIAAVLAVRSTEAQYTPGNPFPYACHKTSFSLSCYITIALLDNPVARMGNI